MAFMLIDFFFNYVKPLFDNPETKEIKIPEIKIFNDIENQHFQSQIVNESLSDESIEIPNSDL